MRETPDARMLLACVAQDLKEHIVPQLSGSARYRMALVFRALTLVDRELDALDRGHEAKVHRLNAQLCDLVGTPKPGYEGDTAGTAAQGLRARELSWPENTADEIQALLLELTRLERNTIWPDAQ